MAELSPATWLAGAAARFPSRPALLASGAQWDYGELYARIGRLANTFCANGLQARSPLAIISERSTSVAWATYLGWYCGCPLLPIQPGRPGLERLLVDCAIKQAIVDVPVADHLPPKVLALPASRLHEPEAGGCAPTSAAAAHTVQLIIPTSGTTGHPRGVRLTGANLAAAVLASRVRLSLGPGDLWLACLPLFHIGGLSILLRCVQARATVLLHEGFDVARVWWDLLEHKVTHLSLVPAMLARLLDHARDAAPPSSLRAVLVGGGPLSEALASRARRAAWPLCVTYGLSETASQVATLCPLAEDWRAGQVGEPLPHVRIEIVDEAGRSTQGIGRIRISGPSVMAGYADAAGRQGQGLSNGGFTSGDLGYLDARGHLHVLGRDDEVLVSGGENVHPCELEGVLMGCPGVEDVAVTARADDIWGQRLVALVVGSVDEDSLGGWCRDSLPSSRRPREFVKVERLPRDAMGKLNRGVLRAWLAS